MENISSISFWVFIFQGFEEVEVDIFLLGLQHYLSTGRPASYHQAHHVPKLTFLIDLHRLQFPPAIPHKNPTIIKISLTLPYTITKLLYQYSTLIN